MIPSRTTREFREAFASLPNDVRRQAQRAYRLFLADPRHPSLRFKKVDEESNVYSVRIGLGYRALGVLEGSTVVWFWIGSHAECDRLLSGLPLPANSQPESTTGWWSIRRPPVTTALTIANSCTKPAPSVAAACVSC